MSVLTPVILGIDPGTYCGWAVLHAKTGARLASGTWDLSPRRYEGSGMRFLRLEGYLNGVRQAFPEITVVAYEEVRRHAGTDAAHIYGGIVAALQSWCERQLLPNYVGMPVGTVKKVATGKGNASKDMMVLASRAQWGDDAPRGLGEDDEADALWVAETWRRSQL